MKRFLTLSISLLIVLAGCGATSATAAIETGIASAKVAEKPDTILASLTSDTRVMGLVEKLALERAQAYAAEQQHQEKLDNNSRKLVKMVGLLKGHVGKTPYVPYAASPSGWDCSGLVMWAYAQIGVDLYHGASHQKHSGKMVKTPKVGDIVAFGWIGYDGAEHSGIYLGDGKMLHAGGHVGMWTEITDISDWADGSGDTLVTYTRVLDN